MMSTPIVGRDLERVTATEEWNETRARALKRGANMVQREFIGGHWWEIWRGGKHGDGMFYGRCVDGLAMNLIGATHGDLVRQIDYTLGDMARLSSEKGERKFRFKQ